MSFVCACVRARSAHSTVPMQRQGATPVEINGFHMSSLCVLIHQLCTALSQMPGLSTQSDLNRLAAWKKLLVRCTSTAGVDSL